MLEKSIERKMVQALEARGAMAWKFTSPGRQGVPDRIVLLPGGRVVFVETKSPTGRLSPSQRVTIKRMRDLGHDVRVVYGAEQAARLIEELMPDGV